MQRFSTAVVIFVFVFLVFAAGCTSTGQAAQKEEPKAQMTKTIAIIGAYSNVVALANSGTAAIGADEIRVFVEGAEQLCAWSARAVQPGETITCRLQSPCTSRVVYAAGPENFAQARC